MSWKIGFQLLRDAPVAADGRLADGAPTPASARQGRGCADRATETAGHDSMCNRDGLFHYLLYAHARGIPKSTDKIRRTSMCRRAFQASATCPAVTAW